MLPDISLIIPCYNAERFLPACFEGLDAQCGIALEVILIDDGSTDGTGDMLEAYAEKRPLTRVLHIRNDGVSNARNRGIDLAAGRYIAFADADDILLPGALPMLLEEAERTGADITSAKHRILDGDTLETHPVEVGPLPEDSGSVVREILHLHRIYNNIWNKLYRRELFETGIRMNTGVDIGEDAVMNLRLYAAAKRIGHLEKETYLYRVHGGSAMAGVTDYARRHRPMLSAFGEILRETGLRESCFTDYLQSCVWVYEKQNGIRACMRRFDEDVRPLVLKGVDPEKLTAKDRRLYDLVRSGLFPAFYTMTRLWEKLTGKRWGIRR